MANINPRTAASPQPGSAATATATQLRAAIAEVKARLAEVKQLLNQLRATSPPPHPSANATPAQLKQYEQALAAYRAKVNQLVFAINQASQKLAEAEARMRSLAAMLPRAMAKDYAQQQQMMEREKKALEAMMEAAAAGVEEDFGDGTSVSVRQETRRVQTAQGGANSVPVWTLSVGPAGRSSPLPTSGSPTKAPGSGLPPS